MLLVVEFKGNYVIFRKKLRRRSPEAPEAVISLLGSRNIFTPFPTERGPPTDASLFLLGLPISIKILDM